MELCQHLEIPLLEGKFTADEMRGADAAFFCGTAAEIVGLASLDDVAFSKKWENTQSARIQHAYRNLVTGHLTLKPVEKTFL
jgi:branched-chain amino acid aminotransferase